MGSNTIATQPRPTTPLAPDAGHSNTDKHPVVLRLSSAWSSSTSSQHRPQHHPGAAVQAARRLTLDCDLCRYFVLAAGQSKELPTQKRHSSWKTGTRVINVYHRRSSAADDRARAARQVTQEKIEGGKHKSRGQRKGISRIHHSEGTMRTSTLLPVLLAAVASAAGEGSVRGTGDLLEPLYPDADDRELAMFAEARRSDMRAARAEGLETVEARGADELADARLDAARSTEMRAAKGDVASRSTEMRTVARDEYPSLAREDVEIDARAVDAARRDEKVVMEKNPFDVPILSP